MSVEIPDQETVVLLLSEICGKQPHHSVFSCDVLTIWGKSIFAAVFAYEDIKFVVIPMYQSSPSESHNNVHQQRVQFAR